MPALPFGEARECVLRTVPVAAPPVETVALSDVHGRVLAQDVVADRPYPPFSRSARDGFAVKADTFHGQARVVGEVAAGAVWPYPLQHGEAVEIMTGAPVPQGADSVFMVEHAEVSGGIVRTARVLHAGDNVVPVGSETSAGAVVLEAGTRINYASIAVLATVGCTIVPVYRKPRVAIIATGDELVAVDSKPEAHQIRNSNSMSLAAQVLRAGGEPLVYSPARDSEHHTRESLSQALSDCDLLLLSGGVSAGKHDLVEPVLASLGAEFFFDRVLIQPGQPLVFGAVRNVYFFGLPGNPASTMVTFELFARAALERLGGQRQSLLPITRAELRTPFRHKTGLTRFLPAVLDKDVQPVKWQGSGDVFALARANCYLIAREDRESWNAGDLIEVLPQ